MAVTDGTGLTKAKPFRIRLRLVRGGAPLDLTTYAVSGTARFATTGTTFIPSFSVIDEDNGVVDVSGTAVQMTDVITESDWLDLEVSFTGSPTINPNAAPVRIPVRPLYEEFVAP